MTIVCLSLSHRFVPAGVLEKLAVSAGELCELLARLHAVPGADEAVVLSTCNRVEVYAAVSGPAGRVTGAMADLVAARGHVPADEIMRMAWIRVGGAAAERLFSLACGLDSLAVGEDQIVAQINAGPDGRRSANHRPGHHGLIDAALRASKRARTQTTISTEGISLARAGLDLAAAHLGGLADCDAVVLGTGSTGKLVARLLRQAGVGRLSVASRSQVRAAEVAAAVGGKPMRTADVPGALADANLLVTALTGNAAAIAEVPLFLTALLVVRGLPALLYARFIGTRRATVAGFMQATTLTFVIVATQIGLAARLISPTTSASLLTAGLLSAALFPAVALRLLVPLGPAREQVRLEDTG